ncbi:MAG: EF-P lysine aminoacylase EpmA [Gammaproteobacteria bacterium]
MTTGWRPAADIQQLRRRAQLLVAIRRFFAERDVLEVETPLLCHATGTDPNLDFFSSQFRNSPQNQTLFLQTSPEFAMKRLLAAGSGSIYQICKAFRNGEAGRYHNPEFTILEWYRVGFDLQQLMDEVIDLLHAVLLSTVPVVRVTYRQLFNELTGLDPLVFSGDLYRRFAYEQGYPEADELCGEDHALWLDFLFSHYVQPRMPSGTIYLVYAYPSIQSSLARLCAGDPRVSERFEVFVSGVELGNGFFELADAAEQEARFDLEIAYRQANGLEGVEKDGRLLDALRFGLPDCSGVAIGLDRLLMIASACDSIEQVLAFPFASA